MGDTYKKNQGTAGLKGVQFQLDLLSVCLLNALHHHKDWKISTEDPEAGKYDDIVIQLSDAAAVLVQAKHKEKRKITKDQLLSSNSKNSDFSLPKYFFSYQEIKSKFSTKTVIICTNTDINPKGLENMLIPQLASTNNMLYYEGDSCSFFTFNENILPDLKTHAEIYFNDNLQGKGVDKAVITDENLKDFLKYLQFFSCYPEGDHLQKIIEQLLSGWYYSRLCSKISYHDIYRKVEDWFKQPKGEYLTEFRAKALLCEIKSEEYCQSLKNYKVSFGGIDFNFTDSKRIFHVKSDDGYLLQMLKIHQALQRDKWKKLYVNPDDNVEVQKRIIEAFELQRYAYLIIVCSEITDKTIIREISCKLREILEKCKYKKVILIAQRNNVLVRQIGLEDIFQIDGYVTFKDLVWDTQDSLLKNKNVVFQGKMTTLEELLEIHNTGECTQSLHSEMLEKLVRREEVKVGVPPLDLDEDIARYYIPRTFEKYNYETEKREGTFSEKNLYDVTEKVTLISDSAGMGKSTVLTRLESIIKEKKSNLWVLRINCNDYTAILRDCLRKNKEVISMVELLNSKETTKMTNQLEELVFSIKEKIVLMFDGVDEISPDYTELIVDLLTQCQQAPNIAKIFIATRPHITLKLKEAVLKVEFFKMLPFTLENQIDFLSNYWTRHLQLDYTIKNQYKRYAEILLHKMWSFSHWKNSFAAIPLQVRMLAEIFEKKVVSTSLHSFSLDWERHKEYLSGDRFEPKNFDIAKLYDMFIEKKRDLFIDRGNPSGSVAANKALIEKFNQCLAYHRNLALEEILNETKVSLFSRVYVKDGDKEDMLKMGIVQRSSDQLQFVHRTFAEYFVAKTILRELQLQNPNVSFQRFIIDEVLRKNEFTNICTFLDNLLENILDSLPHNIFKSYQSYKSHPNENINNENLVFVLSRRGYATILRLILKSIDFKIIRGKVISVREYDKNEKNKNNTLNDLRILVQKAGVNIKNETGFTPLHIAAMGGYLEIVRFLDEQGADINIRSRAGRTALHFAALHDYFDTVKYLVEAGIDINIQDNDGQIVLHLCVQDGQLKIVKYLIDAGIDINTSDNDGCTVLHSAAKNEALDIVKYLVEAGIDINIRNNFGCTALHSAAETGSLDIVRYLVETGVDISIRDHFGGTALQSAADMNQLNIVGYLIEAGIDINSAGNDGSTALHFAAKWGEFDTVKYLVEAGADITVKDNYGRTAIHSAADMNQLEIVRYLVEVGININSTDNVGCTVLHFAVKMNHLDSIRYLVEEGVDINIRNNNGSTVLHYAARLNQLDVLQYLVQAGINLNIKENDGCTALHFAALEGHSLAVKYLVEAGINIDIKDNYGRRALHFAAEKGWLNIVKYLVLAVGDIRDKDNSIILHIAAQKGEFQIVKYLVEANIDINIRDAYGSTALHVAAELGRLNIVKYLVDAGIDINSKNNDGCTALHFAARNGRLDVIKYLVEMGLDTNIRNNDGITAQYFATHEARLNVVKYRQRVGTGGDSYQKKSKCILI